MNALEIIEKVRERDVELLLENNKLVVRGKGARLPEDLALALRDQKAAVMVALGAPHDVAIASILQELRPYLPAAMQQVSEANLLILVNWSILHAWSKAVGSAHL